MIPNHKAWLSYQKIYDVEFANYGNWSGALIASDPDVISVIIINLSDFIEIDTIPVEEPKDLMFSITSLLKARLIKAKEPTVMAVCSEDSYQAQRNSKKISYKRRFYIDLISELEVIASEFTDFYFVDLDHQFSEDGTKKAYDLRNWYFSHCHFSTRGLQQIAESSGEILKRHYEPPLKLLVLDCDNTLWGGVIGEDGLESLTIGQDGIGLAFLDFQKHLIRLQNEGTLLALASKNNEEEVWHVFDNHSSMALKREHITCARVNWQEKSDNIKEIAKELDLGLDSIVFWDDNPLEREKMRILQPSVTTLNIPEDVLEWPQYLIGLNCFSKSSFSASDYKKTDQYQARAIFQKESKNAIDMHAYLKSIKLNPSAKNLNSSSMKRALQLCQKTNQFNVRTIRHSSSDLKELSQKQEDFCFLVSLSDIYGDHGDIGLVCLSRFDRQIVFIDTFLISCRVLGRQLEIWILSEIVKRCELYDVKQIIGEFIPTDRNSPAENIFKGNGFKKIKQKNKLPENIANILSQNSSIFSLSLIDFNPSNLDLFEDV